MSQCIRVTSSPNCSIAAAPTEPTMCSRCGATASNARPTRSSPNVEAATPNTSGTAQARAQSSIRSNGTGEVNRLATNASITCPCVTAEVETSRIGHAASTICRNPNRRPKSATTGRAPSIFSTLGAPYRARRPSTAECATPHH